MKKRLEPAKYEKLLNELTTKKFRLQETWLSLKKQCLEDEADDIWLKMLQIDNQAWVLWREYTLGR